MKIKNKPLISVIDMSYLEARNFFLKNESYCNFDLPPYFKFDTLLKAISKKIDGKKLSSFFKNGKDNSPRKYDDVNHAILHNKDGKFAWRHFELLNPVLYVALVHAMTSEDNWSVIVERFKVFRNNKKIICVSLPIESSMSVSDKAAQVSYWVRNVEQKSIEMALEYEYIFKTDISDCYPSIYTHSIAWALHGKAEAKLDRSDKLVGNVIDGLFCDMSNGQTNGIPQGSSLTDFVAEIVLGYADALLTEKISKMNDVKKYHIIRFRDDYRIFVHNAEDGDRLVKYLCEVLIELGLKLNPSKTISSQNIVKHAIKDDKIFWASRRKLINGDPKDHLLIIHDLAYKYPNSGSLRKALSAYNKTIKYKKINKNIMVIISIIVDIAYNNPNVYPISAAILSKLISCINGKKAKLGIFKKISIKFEKIPNTEHLRIWLQRITLTIDKEFQYGEPLCRLVLGENVKIWNFEWLNDGFHKAVDMNSIVDTVMIETLPEIIDQDEVALFKTYE